MKNNDGKLVDIKIDTEILNGLYPTMDEGKIQENWKKFDVEMSGEAPKITDRDNVAILTMNFEGDNRYSFS